MKYLKGLALLLPLAMVSCSNVSNDSSSSSSSNNDSSSSESSIESLSSLSSDSTPADYTTNKKAKNYYQILVYSFADSDGNGIGDFKGIVDKLDYLVDLGVEGLWLSPIHKCKSYHAYDVLDYYTINSAYNVTKDGKTYDYKYLLEECHKKNISVIMDLIINHTSSDHTWVKDGKHNGWYSGKDIFYGMKDLNFDNQEVKDEMKKIGKYWLNEGFDGFRLDAAMWLYNSAGGGTKAAASSVDHQKNFNYWNEWCSAMREVNPDCFIIGEVLNVNHDLAYQYASAGFDATFDFNVREHVYNAVTNSSYDYVDKTIVDMNKALSLKDDYILGRPLSNHDIGRFSQQHNDMDDAKAYYLTSFNELRLANALNIMMRGNTFVYYGDELGLKGTCPQGYDDMAYRTPMPFGTEKTDSVKYFNGFRGNGETTSTTLSGKTAEQDASNENSLYGVMKKLLNLKKEYNAIKNGKVTKLTDLPTNLNGYTLKDDKNTIAFVYNSSSNSVEYSYTGEVLYSTDAASGNKITMSSKGFSVIKL